MNRTPTLVAPKLATELKQPNLPPRPELKSAPQRASQLPTRVPGVPTASPPAVPTRVGTAVGGLPIPKVPLSHAKTVLATPSPARATPSPVRATPSPALAAPSPAAPPAVRSNPPPVPARRLPPPLPTRVMPSLADSDVIEDTDELRAVSHTSPPAPPVAPPRRGLKVAAIALSILALVATSFAASLPGAAERTADAGGVAPAARGIESTSPTHAAQPTTENASALAKKPAQPHAGKTGKTAKPAHQKKVAKAKAAPKPAKSATRNQKATVKRPHASTK